ncbi:STAS-like domain-containing protein [soil metagenome]
MNIKISEQFSRHPAGRFFSDGEFSGQRFREEWLIPALAKDESLVIDLDDVRGFGSSFLEEAFGGLVRNGFTPSELKRRIALKSFDESLKDEIIYYFDHGHDAS